MSQLISIFFRKIKLSTLYITQKVDQFFAIEYTVFVKFLGKGVPC